MRKLSALLLSALIAPPALFAAKVLDVNFDTNGNQIGYDYYTPYLSVPWGSARIYDSNIADPLNPEYTTSMIGQALEFDGLTHVSVPDNAAIDFGSTSSFSLSFWVKTSSTQSNNTIMDKRSSDVGYHITLYQGYLCLRLGDGSSAYNYWSTSTPKLNDNQWHYVTVTIARNQTTGIQFYVDGALVGTFNSQRVPGSISNSSPLLIGGHSTMGSYRFNGAIDEFAVYNTALSATDLNHVHRGGPISDTVSGSWTSTIPSYHRSGRYARYYTFTVHQADTYTIDLQSATDTYLYLLSGDSMKSSILTSNDDGGTGYNSRIIRTLQPGTYTLEATTYSSGRTDNFTLSIASHPVFSEISTGDISVTLKHLMYKTSKIWDRWDTNTSFEGYQYLSRNDRNKHVFAVQHWLPAPGNVKNIVLLVAGQQGIRLDRQDYAAVVTGQKQDWHYDSSISWINTWKYTKNRSYSISGCSVAGQIIADYQYNNSQYFGFSPDDTVLIMLFDACFYVEEATGSAVVQGIVDEYTNWIMAKTSQAPENIYLAGASRGGSLVSQIAYNLKHKSSWKNYTANTKIIVSCFDGVANHEEGELWANSTRVDNPLEWINTRFCYKSYLSNAANFSSTDNLHLLQIAGGADVFTGTPWHAFYFNDVPGTFEFQ